jgi:hypothetical protein
VDTNVDGYLFGYYAIESIKNSPAKKAVRNPMNEIQLKITVKASEIAHHKPQHSTVNIGRIHSNQVTNP